MDIINEIKTLKQGKMFLKEQVFKGTTNEKEDDGGGGVE